MIETARLEKDKIFNELNEIGKAYPTLKGLLQKMNRKKIDGHYVDDKQVGKVWVDTIYDRNLNPVHFENVCYAFARAERELPDPQDRLLYVIINEVVELMDLDRSRLEQHEKYHQKPVPWRGTAPRNAWCKVIKYMLTRPTLSEDQCEELYAWGNGKGPKPEWAQL